MKNWIRRLWRRRRTRQNLRPVSRTMRIVKWGWRIALVCFAIDVFYLIIIWPDWDQFAAGEIPKSRFIRDYEAQMEHQLFRTGLSWQPVPFKWMPRHLSRAVIVAEDARFYEHHGFDLLAFKEAMDTNLELKEFKYGASTISQQTVKNLFFTGSRNPLRKWHELVLTVGMEFNLEKDRILETYLNIAEFGEGIYGVEAASRHYFGKSAYALDEREAAELAATLPSPIKHNPHTRSKRFLNRASKIYRWMQAHKSG